MSTTAENRPTSAQANPAATAGPMRRRKRQLSSGQSLLAQGEPIVWLIGAGLVICLTMIVSLLFVLVYQGLITFWPAPLVELKTVNDQRLLGEVTRRESFELGYDDLSNLTEPSRAAALQQLNPRLSEQFTSGIDSLRQDLQEVQAEIVRTLSQQAAAAGVATGADQAAADKFQQAAAARLAGDYQQVLTAWLTAGEQLGQQDATGQKLFEDWQQVRSATESWLGNGDLGAMEQELQSSAELLRQLLASSWYERIGRGVRHAADRRLLRTENFELTGTHHQWVSDFEVVAGSESLPQWAMLFERQANGRFYGFAKSLTVDGKSVAEDPAAVWNKFRELHPGVRRRWAQARRLESRQLGRLNYRLDQARLAVVQAGLDHGDDSPPVAEAQRRFESLQSEVEKASETYRQQIAELDQENAKFQLQAVTADGTEAVIELADVVRAAAPNEMAWSQKLETYLGRWWEFVSSSPRQANSEGGVFPAIWGTVTMTLLMTVAVVPFGVLAALYLREYAKGGWLISLVRIAVNNLAGVPSIVFGVFGLGFFCYLIGANIDQLFFQAKLPNPTFGTGGIMWAALTLSLLTLPVVIVATEEALAAVPRSMREGSLACGATKWQTIRRIVLPRALPGIMTGTILAMARGAGEVAPLMLVGAMKVAKDLPVDDVFPFVHLQRSFMHLGFHVFDVGFQSQNSEAAKPMVFTTTLLLISLIAVLNILAIQLRAALRRRYRTGQF
ncbi:MAG: phosphate ABC transporter permease PstA [Pirellulales bacterium]